MITTRMRLPLAVLAALAIATTAAAQGAATASPEATAKKPLSALPYTPSLDVTAMDRAVDPCVDFFQYSCGNFPSVCSGFRTRSGAESHGTCTIRPRNCWRRYRSTSARYSRKLIVSPQGVPACWRRASKRTMSIRSIACPARAISG